MHVLEVLEREKKRVRVDMDAAGSTTGEVFGPKVRVTWAPRVTRASRLGEVDLVGDVEGHGGPREDFEADPGEIPSGYGTAARVFLGTRCLMWRRGRLWPTSAVDVVDYVTEKMSGARAACVPRSFGASLVMTGQASDSQLRDKKKSCRNSCRILGEGQSCAAGPKLCAQNNLKNAAGLCWGSACR